MAGAHPGVDEHHQLLPPGQQRLQRGHVGHPVCPQPVGRHEAHDLGDRRIGGRAAVRPTNGSLEHPMSTLKFVRVYARYLATTFATVAFKLTTN